MSYKPLRNTLVQSKYRLNEVLPLTNKCSLEFMAFSLFLRCGNLLINRNIIFTIRIWKITGSAFSIVKPVEDVLIFQAIYDPLVIVSKKQQIVLNKYPF